MGTLFKGNEPQPNEIMEPLTAEQKEFAGKHYKLVHGFATTRMKREVVLSYDEIVEHGHQMLLKCVRNFNGDYGAFSTYFYQAMNNHLVVVRKAKIRDALKFRRVTDLVAPRGERWLAREQSDYVYTEAVVEDKQHTEEIEEFYQEALERLRPLERVIVRRILEYRHKQTEIAEEMKCSKQRIGQIYQGALKRLREHYLGSVNA